MQSHNPKLVFLSKTRQSEERMKNLRWRLGLKGCLAVGSEGNSGGIALFWDESISVTLIGMCRRLIDVKVQENPLSPPFRVSFVYGEPRVEDRKKMCELLQRIKAKSQDPWLMLGDFNEALWQFEHFSETKCGENRWKTFGVYWNSVTCMI
jgi:hypothetical protein